MATHLTVNINRQHLGKIILEESGERYALKYAQSWLDGGGFPVSPHLKPGECASESVRRFLANLLPEGRWLEELAISSHISRANIFGLVAAIGTETTGALTFRLGDSPSEEPETSFRPVTAGDGCGAGRAHQPTPECIDSIMGRKAATLSRRRTE